MHLRLCGMQEIASCLLAQAQVWKSEVCASCSPHLPYWDLEPIKLDLISRDHLRNNESHIKEKKIKEKAMTMDALRYEPLRHFQLLRGKPL